MAMTPAATIEFEWAKLLLNSEPVYARDRQALVDLKNLQITYYQAILEFIGKPKSGNKSVDLNYWQKTANVINHAANQCTVVENSGDDGRGEGFITRSILPILTAEAYTEFLKSLAFYYNLIDNLDTKISVSNFIFIGILSAIKEKNHSLDSNAQEFINRLPIEVARYQAVSTYLRASQELYSDATSASTEIEKLTNKVESFVADTQSAVDSIKADADGRLQEIKSEIERFQSVTAGAETKVLNALKNLEEITGKSKDEIEGIAQSTVARANLAALGTMWEGIAERSKRSMRIFGGSAGIMMVVGILLLICKRETILGWVSDHGGNITDASVLISLQLSRIVVVTIPLILYLWGIKIAVRMFIRSMALYDDAVQRKTILDSYFFLSEKGKIDKDAQPIVIGAVCRPVPGHGADGFELPDIAQLLQAGKNYFK